MFFGDEAPIWRFIEKLGAIEDPEAARVAAQGEYLMEVFPALALASYSPAFLGYRKGPRYRSLLKIIAACNGNAVTSLIAAFELQLDEKNIAADAARRVVYKMRNSLVHFRGKPTITLTSEERWDQIIAAMLEVVAESYDAFGELFHVNILGKLGLAS